MINHIDTTDFIDSLVVMMTDVFPINSEYYLCNPSQSIPLFHSSVKIKDAKILDGAIYHIVPKNKLFCSWYWVTHPGGECYQIMVEKDPNKTSINDIIVSLKNQNHVFDLSSNESDS